MSDTFIHRVNVRYMEVDQQGVVFNAWYLAYFDDALTAFLEHHGVPYAVMMDKGYDVQLVTSTITWKRGVTFGEDVRVAVTTARIGTTSFALDFVVTAGEEEDARVTGETTYVVIATDGSGKTPIPEFIREVLVRTATEPAATTR